MSDNPFDLEASESIDGPVALDKGKEEHHEIDLSVDDYDVVSKRDHVEKPTREQMARMYGDLPEELWDERADVEQHFLAAKPDQKHYDDQSHGFSQARRTFIVGLNDDMACAFQCPDVEVPEESSVPPPTSPLDAIRKANAHYAKRNAAFALKTATNALEVNALYHHLSYDISNLNNQGSAQLKLQEFRALQKVDPSLEVALKRAGPLLSEAMKTLPKEAPLNPQRSKVRPGGGFASCEYFKSPLNDTLTDAPTLSKKTLFRLLTCRVPRPNEKKPPYWKDRSCTVECMMGTIPAASINNKNELAVVYQPAVKQRGLVRLDIFHILPNKVERVHRYEFAFPERFAAEGMLCTDFHDSGVFVLSFSSGCMVLDAERTEFSVIWLTMQEEENASTKRHVTCVRSEGDVVLIGTDKGELFTVNWRDQEILNVDHTPAVEPVFSAVIRNKNAFMHTVAGITVARASPYRPLLFGMERPLAIDTCGDLIFVMTKYGAYQVYSTNVRKVLYQGAPVPQKLLEMGAQHAYQGIKAYPEHIVCVYPNGVVRRITLIR